MLATVLGVPFDPDEAWDARWEEWHLAGHVVTTQNHTAVVEAPEDGTWVTTASAAVFCG